MCVPCKVVTNGLTAVGKINGWYGGLEELHSRGFDLPASAYRRAKEVLCGFDDDMDEVLNFINNGPYVPFKKEIIL